MVFVLGDTSYSECCVDEIAAQHVNADVVVHIGIACLNPVVHSPVIYLFGQGKLDLELCVKSFIEQIPDTTTHVIIVAETPFQVYVDPLKEKLADYVNLLTTVPVLSAFSTVDPTAPSETIIPASLTSSTPSTHTHVSAIPHRAHRQLQTDLSSYVLFQLGIPPPPAQLHLTTLFSRPPIFIDPETSSPLAENPSLARRYKMMLSARAASTIGILVNTLSLRSSSELILSLQRIIRDAGKKYYVVAVGKPNVAKLANFDVVDAWVVVGCARGGMILDREGEFFKPLVTPYELKLAMKRDIVWGVGEWILDFDTVLNLKDDDGQNDEDDVDENSVDDEDAPPEFDAVSGRYIASRPLRSAKTSRKTHIDIEIENSDGEMNKLSANSKGSSHLLAVSGKAGQLATRGSRYYSTAGAYLQSSRFWKGLGSDFGEDEESDRDNDRGEDGERRQGARLEEGRKGIARGYVNPDP
ncbi:putative diphthamide synthesis protein-domain-containing protein [Lipomyces kononenkoae]|uniref:Diphthamide synthesis protein-domain-containing protein n=1 Tax=Lipomyces kononenkoae TaxID=34357 RepID=A0ACC3T4D4_LIPKO